MNNFDGQVKLYPEICIDNFDSSVVYDARVRCYILTHFHDDHMRHLEDVEFYRTLSENRHSVRFYCSSITRRFIETCAKYAHLAELCTEVACEAPFTIDIGAKQTVTAVFCGAGHCPGSVMVFLEGARGNVLFTGDFRLPAGCAARLSFLKQDSNTNKLAPPPPSAIKSQSPNKKRPSEQLL